MECFWYAVNAHGTLKMALSLCARCQLCISGHSLLFSEVWFNLGKLRSFLFWKDRMSISLDVWPAADDHTSNWQSAPKVHAFTLSCLLAFPFAWCMAVVKFQQRWVSQSRLFQRWKATKNLPSSFEWLTGERDDKLQSDLPFSAVQVYRVCSWEGSSMFGCLRQEGWTMPESPASFLSGCTAPAPASEDASDLPPCPSFYIIAVGFTSSPDQERDTSVRKGLRTKSDAWRNCTYWSALTARCCYCH